MRPTVIHIAIRVSNLARAIEYYCEKIGFPLIFREDGQNYARLDAGSVNLGLVAGVIEPEASPRIVLTIGTSDIEATYAELKTRGVVFVTPPTRQPWGVTLAPFTDPDGNLFYLEATADV